MSDKATGKSFPKDVSFTAQGKTFKLAGTGVSTRKKFFVKVYSIASYIEDPASVKSGDVFNNIINSKKAKQLSIIWVRDIEAKKVQDGFVESLGKAGASQQDTDKFVKLFGNVKNGDSHTIRSLPDGSVTVSYNGEDKGSIKSEAFAKALWSIWFGKDSVVKRDQLVSLLK
jgi:hypothetical protein